MEKIGHDVLNKLDVPLSARRFNPVYYTLEPNADRRYQIRLSYTPIQFSKPSSSPCPRTSLFNQHPCFEISFQVWLQRLFERFDLVCWSETNYTNFRTRKSRRRIALLMAVVASISWLQKLAYVDSGPQDSWLIDVYPYGCHHWCAIG